MIVADYGMGKNKKPQEKFCRILDEADENDRVMKEILLENGFNIIFPANVLEESEALPETISVLRTWKAEKDFRKVLTFTIDPADAKDFDDAISFRQTKE